MPTTIGRVLVGTAHPTICVRPDFLGKANSPYFRGQFKDVWLWKEWPGRWWDDEAGIDIVARTRTGELWAIQAKAYGPHQAVTKTGIDSFLTESNRSEFAYRLLMATTDDIGATARRTLHGQEKPVGLVLRGHLLAEEVQWPVQIGGIAARLPRWTARPHQATAIEAVVNGFQDHDRGRLIMACGTGKTLTALWIAERLANSRKENDPLKPEAQAKDGFACGSGFNARTSESRGVALAEFSYAGACPVALAGAAEPCRVWPPRTEIADPTGIADLTPPLGLSLGALTDELHGIPVDGVSVRLVRTGRTTSRRGTQQSCPPLGQAQRGGLTFLVAGCSWPVNAPSGRARRGRHLPSVRVEKDGYAARLEGAGGLCPSARQQAVRRCFFDRRPALDRHVRRVPGRSSARLARAGRTTGRLVAQQSRPPLGPAQRRAGKAGSRR